MNELKKNDIFNDVKTLKGVGKQLSLYLKNKRIEKIKGPDAQASFTCLTVIIY